METAPLTAAHAKARDAANDATSHDAAAEEFAKAKQGIKDPEALRILSLLEQNHRQLSQIIKTGLDPLPSNNQSPASPTSQPGADAQAATEQIVVQSSVSEDPPTPDTTPPSTTTTTPTPKDKAAWAASPVLSRKPVTEATTSLATNLATARGIPPKQQRRSPQPAPRATAAQSLKEARAQGTKGKSGKSGHYASRLEQVEDGNTRSNGDHHRHNDQTAAKPSTSLKSPSRSTDDAFQKFYSTFETLLSKISAPLAFTGLPLVSEDTSGAQTSTETPQNSLTKDTRRGHTTSTHPNVEQVFSRAALRALQEQAGPSSRAGQGNIHESFYVVPTGGGTMSYANVLSLEKHHSRRASLGSVTEQDEEIEQVDKFEDAPELPQTPKAAIGRRQATPSSPTTATHNGKTLEELQLENESLKELTTSLSNRLYMWEKSAQSQSMALQQSIRKLQPIPSASSPAGYADKVEQIDDNSEEQEDSNTSTSSKDERIKELEEQLRLAEREKEKYGRETEKLKTVVLRYRERWEKLKEGAAKRREKGPEGEKSES